MDISKYAIYSTRKRQFINEEYKNTTIRKDFFRIVNFKFLNIAKFTSTCVLSYTNKLNDFIAINYLATLGMIASHKIIRENLKLIKLNMNLFTSVCFDDIISANSWSKITRKVVNYIIDYGFDITLSMVSILKCAKRYR